MGSKVESAGKPHAVFVPLFPAQSHIMAMLKLAKLFHHKGFHITFLNTEFNHRRLLESRGPNSLDGLPDFRFETIPDCLLSSDTSTNPHLLSVIESIKNNFLAIFRDFLAKLNDIASSNVPPVTCIVSDGFVTSTITAAEEVGIPILMFFTLSASSFMCFKQFSALKERGLTPLKDESYLTNGYLDKIIDWIPGMKGIRLRDIPSYIRTINSNDLLFEFCMEEAERAPKASAIVLHTFDALEQDVLNALSPMFSRVYAIGPLQLLLNQIPENPLKFIGCNLWKEETECIQWLDSKAPNSVVYVNFGSIVLLTKEQLVEFGMGLANSNHPFLWVFREDSAILAAEFVAEITKEKGFLGRWCPQEAVLNHPAIGGFLTHSGWNSTIESLSAGVPMLCWPVSGDQQTNCRYTCMEWGIGMEIDGNVKREEVEKHVRELMEQEKGKKMKKKAMEWKKLAEEATSPKGSSSMNLDEMIHQLLSSKASTLLKNGKNNPI